MERSKNTFLQMTLTYVQKSLKNTQALLELINEFSKVAGYKTNTQSQNTKKLPFYTLIMNHLEKKLRNNSTKKNFNDNSIMIASKRIKISK